ncbi:hypothetical protein [Streptomyces murinus]|uniref:hypothetical protein n=1 Tax=Streptomyces murinus TaxID=33900 RepID=UPI003819CB29
MTALQPEADLTQQLAALDQLRERLPLTDPDRHALDVDADQRFAQLASDHPEACKPTSHHQRVALLLNAVISQGGEWTTRRVQRFYRAAGIPAPLRATARKDLHALHMQGHLVLHEEDAGRRFYTVNTRKA